MVTIATAPLEDSLYGDHSNCYTGGTVTIATATLEETATFLSSLAACFLALFSSFVSPRDLTVGAVYVCVCGGGG